ncbi:hypothetical protein CQJ94_00880 [Glycomyces fuscus]|nr:hypothetical protein CQJ94_00880 [Glycomyces fuscus]
MRARLVLPGLAVLAAAWAVGLASEERFFPFPTVFGNRVLVPTSLLAVTVGVLLLNHGLDRSRAPVESTAARPVGRWDALWVAAAALASIGAGLTAALAGNPEGPVMARATVAGLGGYLVARLIIRTDLAALAPLALLTANTALWDVRTRPGSGPWLLAAPDDAAAWGVSVLVLVVGMGGLLTSRGWGVRPTGLP